jgi:NAD(P)-dependent dehydrogenase (short-subunit alcohol dehydrogenase family)
MNRSTDQRSTMALGTAIIIGAGPGLGLELARTFAGAGHPVALLARDQARLDAFAADLAADGHRARGYAADAADPASLRAAVDAAIADLGPADVLVYNVGVLAPDSPVGGDDQDWAANTAMNVLGARVAADAVLPALRDGRGSLLFTGGGYALNPSTRFSSLSVGKAALRAYARLLHDELAGTGVHAASVTITAGIGTGDPRFDPAAIAGAYLGLHRQPEAEWQHELVY